MKDIYQMKLHEEAYINKNTMVLRVPGGWVYKIYVGNTGTSVFIPFHNEFMKE